MITSLMVMTTSVFDIFIFKLAYSLFFGIHRTRRPCLTATRTRYSCIGLQRPGSLETSFLSFQDHKSRALCVCLRCRTLDSNNQNLSWLSCAAMFTSGLLFVTISVVDEPTFTQKLLVPLSHKLALYESCHWQSLFAIDPLPLFRPVQDTIDQNLTASSPNLR